MCLFEMSVWSVYLLKIARVRKKFLLLLDNFQRLNFCLLNQVNWGLQNFSQICFYFKIKFPTTLCSISFFMQWTAAKLEPNTSEKHDFLNLCQFSTFLLGNSDFFFSKKINFHQFKTILGVTNYKKKNQYCFYLLLNFSP